MWRELRPILLLLLMAVVVPAACLLWFMSEAVSNERFAVRQRLTELYGARLADVQRAVDSYWQRKADALGQSYAGEGEGERFARLVEAGIADSVVVYDSSGRVCYPVISDGQGATYGKDGPATREATELLDRIRALIRAGDTAAAAELVRGELAQPRYDDARDPAGRLIVPNAQLLILRHSAPSADDDTVRELRDRLVARLRDYRDLSMPSGQRCFLMSQLLEDDSDLSFPTLAAERLAIQYVHSGAASPNVSHLISAGTDGLWRLESPDKTVVALYRQAELTEDLHALIVSDVPFSGATVQAAPSASATKAGTFLRVPAGRLIPDWELRLYLDGADPFADAANRRIGFYVWIGLLAIAFVTGLASVMAGVFLRQVRLTRMKNNFVATVSHELKTPLASMRVLVDTLLEGRTRDEQQTAEYLGLIARENERLSRLIDNFLSFSRMERNKRTFDFADLAPEQVVGPAVDAVRERFESETCSLKVELPTGLPHIVADRDAMITVLLNLMDNACKYSPARKQVTVRAYAEKDVVYFVVADQGIGLSRRESRKILDRFYQVDQRLSRSTGGCGLGLSIVKFIVNAHHGTIDIQSQPGKGSTFTVGIPAVGKPDNP